MDRFVAVAFRRTIQLGENSIAETVWSWQWCRVQLQMLITAQGVEIWVETVAWGKCGRHADMK
jgi:hypothetical protein